MLLARLPWLCQRCHLNTRHPGTLYDGTNAATLTAAGAMEYSLTIRDRDYRLTYQNALNKQMFGDRTGEQCYRVFAGMSRICDDCPVELAFADGVSHDSLRTVTMPNGELSYWENTAKPSG